MRLEQGQGPIGAGMVAGQLRALGQWYAVVRGRVAARTAGAYRRRFHSSLPEHSYWRVAGPTDCCFVPSRSPAVAAVGRTALDTGRRGEAGEGAPVVGRHSRSAFVFDC